MLLTGLTDYHMHTTLCGHASGTMDEYINRAKDLGLQEIGFSEHIYLYHLPEDQRDPELAMRAEEMDTYIEMVAQARQRHPDITIKLGLEADYIQDHEAQLESILTAYPWDYVYGSVHFMGSWGFDDARYIDEYSRRQINDLYTNYFALITAAAKTGLFDVMAHLDLIKKFG
ncbi:MAG: histidinol-phosphatase HisJ family protein, partial [Chloroflexia bacterium]